MALVKVHDPEILSTLQVLTPKMLTVHGRKVIPSTFYIHCFHDLKVEQHQATPGYDFNQWAEWMADNRIYIEKENSIL